MAYQEHVSKYMSLHPHGWTHRALASIGSPATWTTVGRPYHEQVGPLFGFRGAHILCCMWDLWNNLFLREFDIQSWFGFCFLILQKTKQISWGILETMLQISGSPDTWNFLLGNPYESYIVITIRAIFLSRDSKGSLVSGWSGRRGY